MARTPLLRMLQRIAFTVAVTDDGPALTRREALKGVGAAAGALLAAGALPTRRVRAQSAPRVAIVGAGISGLTAALTLWDAGVEATVYEGSARVGGRMESDTTSWASGQVSEHCGELIDTGHRTMRRLARRFHLRLVNLRRAEVRGSTDTYFFGGSYYRYRQAVRDFGPVYRAVRADLRTAPFPTRYDDHTEGARVLDNLSVHDWIETRVPGGHASPMGRLLDIAYTTEYGLDTTEQSCLNLIYLLAYQPERPGFAEFGVSDETFHLDGGNERLPQAIADALPDGAIRLGTRLKAVARNDDGTFTLALTAAGGGLTVEVDRVVLALPFSVLRTIDYSTAGFGDVKRTAIEQLGYGTNAKLAVQLSGRPWRERGPWRRASGGSYADTGYQNSWDASRGQPGKEGLLVNYMGGSIGAALTDASTPGAQAAAQQFLARLEPVFPGVTATWNQRATLSLPARDVFRLGSYACYRVGQYTSFAGVEGERAGNCHFAGEHCSTDFQGFMEGAAREGIRAAREILREL